MIGGTPPDRVRERHFARTRDAAIRASPARARGVELSHAGEPSGVRFFDAKTIDATFVDDQNNSFGADFDSANLTQTQFPGAILEVPIFADGTPLTGASFDGAPLNSSSFEYTHGNRVNFTNTVCDGCSCRSAELGNVGFENAELTNAGFEYAELTGAFFSGATLTNVQCPDGTFVNGDGTACDGHFLD